MRGATKQAIQLVPTDTRYVSWLQCAETTNACVILIAIGAVQSRNHNIFGRYIARGWLPKLSWKVQERFR